MNHINKLFSQSNKYVREVNILIIHKLTERSLLQVTDNNVKYILYSNISLR